MQTRKVVYVISTVFMLLALLPFSVQAASWTNAGITLITPDSYTSCSPSDTITASGFIPGEWVDVWFFDYDPVTNYATPIYHQAYNATSGGVVSVPFPYPATIAGQKTFIARFDVIRNSVITKVEGQWTVNCNETPTPPPPSTYTGCTPGYWRNHLEDWAATGYSPSADFDSTFGVNLFNPNITLGAAIKLGGGGVNVLARHGTAALLSAAHPDVNYPYTVAQVIAYVQAGNINPLITANELGCSIP